MLGNITTAVGSMQSLLLFDYVVDLVKLRRDGRGGCGYGKRNWVWMVLLLNAGGMGARQELSATSAAGRHLSLRQSQKIEPSFHEAAPPTGRRSAPPMAVDAWRLLRCVQCCAVLLKAELPGK